VVTVSPCGNSLTAVKGSTEVHFTGVARAGTRTERKVRIAMHSRVGIPETGVVHVAQQDVESDEEDVEDGLRYDPNSTSGLADSSFLPTFRPCRATTPILENAILGEVTKI
jgi:hypothetical protein